MQQHPKEFDPARLEIQIKSPEPENIEAGMGFSIKNEQSVVQRPVKNISMQAQNVQKEPFQISSFFIFAQNFTKLIFDFVISCSEW